MFTLIVKGHFDAAHYLPKYKGKCENLHGHRWTAEIFFVFEDTISRGMCMDFKILKNTVNSVLDRLDHRSLNLILKQPTAENIAKYIYDKLEQKFKPYKYVTKVRLWETPDCAVEYESE